MDQQTLTTIPCECTPAGISTAQLTPNDRESRQFLSLFNARYSIRAKEVRSSANTFTAVAVSCQQCRHATYFPLRLFKHETRRLETMCLTCATFLPHLYSQFLPGCCN